MKIPKLYETEGIDFPEKIVYEKWEIPDINYYWLIAELDSEKELAFGYANLNDDEMAEWGYINMKELREVGAEKTENWKPRTYTECISEIEIMKLDQLIEKER
jgi:hypothetical protein